MGFFDFLYKTRPPGDRAYPPRPRNRQPQQSPHYKQRTATYVPHRANSLPNEQEPGPRSLHYDRKSPASRSYNQKYDSSHNHRFTSKSQASQQADNVDYHQPRERPKSMSSLYEDDFTRLSRLEKKIDNYIKRHNELSLELNDIEKDLGLILGQFNEEFQESIDKSDNRHTREIGVRILDKLNNFSSIDNSVQVQPVSQITVSDKPKHSNHNHIANDLSTTTDVLSPPSLPKTQRFQQPKKLDDEFDSNRRYAKSGNKGQSRVPSAYQPSPLVNSHSSAYSPKQDQDYTLNLTGVERTKGQVNGGETASLVKAHYAVVNSSTPYTTDTVTSRLTHYKSTPSLVQQVNQSVAYDYGGVSQAKYAADDSYLGDGNQSRMYINMSMVMHSDHPVIEHCFRRIEILRPRIMGYRSEHKLSVYKELDTEIIHLMNRLDSVDCGNDVLFQQDKNIALCELHNLAGVLERAIECVDPECVICNSFIYKNEVSV